VVFKVDRAGNETVLYSFTGGADGAQPLTGVIRDEDGNLYGIASVGGDSSGACAGIGPGCGVVFKLDAAGKETILHTFTGGTDGSTPYGRRFRRGSYLYGTTFFGGDLRAISAQPLEKV